MRAITCNSEVSGLSKRLEKILNTVLYSSFPGHISSHHGDCLTTNTRPLSKIDELTLRVQALPAELIDKIYEDTFVVKGQTVDMALRPKPPALLQTDSTSRDLFAQSFYRNTTFSFKFEADCWKWIDLLDLAHQSYLSDVSVTYCDPRDADRDLSHQCSTSLRPSQDLAQESIYLATMFRKGRWSHIKLGVVRLDNTYQDALEEAERREKAEIEAEIEEMFVSPDVPYKTSGATTELTCHSRDRSKTR